MAIYSNKWDILDIRFLGIWLFFSNISNFLEKTNKFDFIPKENVVAWVSITLGFLIIIPFTLLLISENGIIKNLTLRFASKFKILYSLIGFACAGIMAGYTILYFLGNIGKIQF